MTQVPGARIGSPGSLGSATGHRLGNRLLDELGAGDRETLAPSLVEVGMTAGELVQAEGRPVPQVLFPLSGVVSLMVELGDDVRGEAATVGREGMLGLSVFLGAPPTERATVLVAGRALALSAADFGRQVRVIDGPLERILRRYAASMFTQLARNAACNRVHSVRQRTARWLLSTADRTDGPSFVLTQDLLAHVLAVRRASVNAAARALVEDGCISYVRGVVTIEDPRRLQDQACSCYQVLARVGAAGSSQAALSDGRLRDGSRSG